MEEAERLCDRVAIMDYGSFVALDTPERLINMIGADNRVVFTTWDIEKVKFLADLHSVSRMEFSGSRVVLYGKSDQLVVDVVVGLSEKSIKFRDLRTEQPNLEDVFLTITGRKIRSDG